MSQHQPFIPLDTVINDYLNESEQSNNKYFKVFHIAYRGFENLGIDFFYRIQAVKLPVNANKTVTLPANYLKWTKIGRLNSRGEIIPLWYNDKLTTYASLSPDRLTKTQDDSTIGADWNNSNGVFYNYWNGAAYTNVYGTPSGAPFAGSFKVDIENSVILLDEHYQDDYIMLEYVATPVEGGEYYLPVQFREALIAWLWWKDGKARPVASHMRLGAARDAKHEFYNERKNAIAQWKPSTIYEKYQVHQEMSRQAIKT
jgi:hypothetical protein